MPMAVSTVALIGLLLVAAASSTQAFEPEDQLQDYSDNISTTWRALLMVEEAVKAAVAPRKSGPSRCAPGCTKNGVCNEELGRCDCPRHLTGPACDQVPANLEDICDRYGFSRSACSGDFLLDSKEWQPCLNSCNQRGRCRAGICHCDPGFWGMDCSLSLDPATGKTQLLAGQGYTPRKHGVKIYVYDLPGNVTSWINYKQIDRPLHLLLVQRLQSAGLLTPDGEEADYFYIPLNTRWDVTGEKLAWTLSYIKQTWPWWSRDNGHRHLITHTGDLGMMEIPLSARRLLNDSIHNMTWLTHWGVHTQHPIASWAPAHRPGKDIVIPAMITTPGFHQSPYNPLVVAEAEAAGKSLERKGTLFFAGRICGDRRPPDPATGKCSDKRRDYSASTRQRVYEHHHMRPGYKLAPWTDAYWRDMASHKFCLAPTGGGYGKRQVLVALMGCVPVTVTDGLYQPFEPEIDWSGFSVHVPEQDIPRIPQILGDISPARLRTMQSKLYCAAQHLFYSSTLGGIFGEDGRYDAFETLFEILRVRKEHPDVPPEQYTRVDTRFRKFVNCDLGDPNPALLCAQGPDRQRPEMPTCAECHRAVRYQRTGGTIYSWAGGAVCCSELQGARCPRVWEETGAQ